MKSIQVVIGPTAAGKSNVAIELAKESGGQIISADAIQVYKGMDIGSAKLPAHEQQGIPHHLMSIRQPDEPYSVANFLDDCHKTVDALQQSDTPIIICGGTPLYIRAFLHNYEFPPEHPEADTIRQELNDLYDEKGLEALVTLLKQDAPERCKNIDMQNPRRVQRAIEQYRLGISLEESQKHAAEPREDCHITGLSLDREHLYDRINTRVNLMIEQGLIEEVEGLIQRYPIDMPAFTALGYKECIQYLSGGISKSEMIELIKQKTRNFAKRQITWYRKFSNVNWLQIS